MSETSDQEIKRACEAAIKSRLTVANHEKRIEQLEELNAELLELLEALEQTHGALSEILKEPGVLLTIATRKRGVSVCAAATKALTKAKGESPDA